MWIRLRDCKDYQCLIDIGHSRADQLILPWQYLHYISFFFRFIKNLYLYIVSHQRLDLFFPEYTFGFAFINTEFYYVNVVESGNSFYNFSLHNLLLASRGPIICIRPILVIVISCGSSICRLLWFRPEAHHIADRTSLGNISRRRTHGDDTSFCITAAVL